MVPSDEKPPSFSSLETNVRSRNETLSARLWRRIRRWSECRYGRWFGGRSGRPAEAPDPDRFQVHLGTAETVIRPLLSTEAGAYLAHLVRLDPDSRRHRFGRPIDDRELTSFVAATDWSRALVLAHIEAGVVRGAAHLAWPDIAWLGGDGELAVAVEGAWRRRGIGRSLLERATAEARARGLAGIMFFTQTDNEAMLSLARYFDAPLTRIGHEIEGRVPLALPPAAVRARYYAGMAV
jgi:ribosomal protein S18 acetylase RimI-like enzyme